MMLSRLKELIHYDPESGHFTWLIKRGRSAVAGSMAGTITNRGYRQIYIDSIPYLALGVHWHSGANKWEAKLFKEKKCIYLGLFEDIELAELVVIEARDKHFGEFAPMLRNIEEAK